MAPGPPQGKLESQRAAPDTVRAADDESRSAGEVLASVAANVAAVPLVLGFVALGGVVLAGRAPADVAGQALGSRNGRRARRPGSGGPPARKRRPRRAPAGKRAPLGERTA